MKLSTLFFLVVVTTVLVACGGGSDTPATPPAANTPPSTTPTTPAPTTPPSTTPTTPPVAANYAGIYKCDLTVEGQPAGTSTFSLTTASGPVVTTDSAPNACRFKFADDPVTYRCTGTVSEAGALALTLTASGQPFGTVTGTVTATGATADWTADDGQGTATSATTGKQVCAKS